MLSSIINNTIIKIDNTCKNTTEHKKNKLLALKADLQKLQLASDLDNIYLSEFIAGLNSNYLQDKSFTFKKISLFGKLKSRSEILVQELINALSDKTIFFFFEKINALAENHPLNNQQKEIIQLINNRDYKNALCQFDNLINLISDSISEPLPKTSQFIRTWLTRQIELQMDETNVLKTYNAVRWPVFEIRASQKIYDLDELKILMNNQNNKVLSFTYAIDLHNNIVFSLGANSSYHINLCGGKPVYGAGEVYLRNTKNGIEVTSINNKSGLYTPTSEFLKSVKQWFEKNNFLTLSTQLEDERLKLIQDYVEQRLMLK